jgi:hypothetical protein
VFAALVLAFPDRWLLAGAVAALPGGALVYLLTEMAVPEWFGAYPATLGDPAGRILRDLLLSGAYPLATWGAPLLFGLWVGRRDLSSSRSSWTLLGLSVAVTAPLVAGAVVGWVDQTSTYAELLTSEPHGQMPLWMLGSIGSGCAVLGGALLLVERFPRATWPLVVTGQMALSVYVGHLLLLDASAWLVRRGTVPDAFFAVGVFFLVVACICVLWRATLPRGPLEAALAGPWWIVEHGLRHLAGILRARPGPSTLGRRVDPAGEFCGPPDSGVRVLADPKASGGDICLGDGPLNTGPGQAAYAVPTSIMEDCVRMAERHAEEQR